VAGLASPYSYLELSDGGGGVNVLSGMAGGAWLIRDPWPWMLVKILAAFVPVHRFLPEACGILSGSLGPAWVGATIVVCIPLIESLSWSVMRRVSAPWYMLSSMLASSFVR
jgi:hypothetical protein